MPQAGLANWQRLQEALAALEAVEEPDEARRHIGRWRTEHGFLEVSLTPPGTRGYPDLLREARPLTLFGVDVLLASLADVIRIKQTANQNMDQRVLPVLRELLANRDLDAK